MPPHLHPRSRTTSSLFATTVAATVFVVLLPHVLPCPAPRRVALADGPRRRSSDGPGDQATATVEPQPRPEIKDGLVQFSATVADTTPGTLAAASATPTASTPLFPPARRRECPMPKPGGILGAWLGCDTTKTAANVVAPALAAAPSGKPATIEAQGTTKGATSPSTPTSADAKPIRNKDSDRF